MSEPDKKRRTDMPCVYRLQQQCKSKFITDIQLNHSDFRQGNKLYGYAETFYTTTSDINSINPEYYFRSVMMELSFKGQWKVGQGSNESI